MSVLMSPPGSPRSRSGETSYVNMNNDESSRYRRELLEILGSLRSLGLSQVLDLPQIAVIGSQSAGKSSLIEALCKIKLPRSTGTCTRCPIECRSQYADRPWRARVFLKIERDNQESSRWGEEIPFGDPIDDPELIEERIKRAQLAVLHPRVDPAGFLNGDSGPGGGLSFTKNCVLVKISGRELADLSFVDLPGIIANTADPRNKGDIKLVQKLISSYMQKKSTINLIVITCEADIETQGAGLIARNYDPTGERTIGVLTKPDRIEPRQERQWIPLVMGESNPLANGWFCVKQLGTDERETGLTWEDARIQESTYFDNAPGWSAIPEEYRTNLGSRNLAFKLGQVLSNEIQTRLPAIRNEIERLIKANDIEVQKLPKLSPHGHRDLVYHLITEFVKDIEKQLINGSPGAGFNGVVQRIRRAHVDLRVELQQAAPVFLPCVSGSRYPELPRPSFLPADEIWLSRSPCGNEYNTADVAEYADGARTREWPGHYPFQVMLDYTEKFVERWKHPVDQCFETTCSYFESKLLGLIGDHFSPYSHGGLMDEVKVICMELVGRCRNNTTEALAKDLDQEAHPESTHEDLYLTYERQYSDYYRDFFNSSVGLKRLAQALEAGENSNLLQAISVLEECGLPLISPSEWRGIHPTNKSDRSVLNIMSSVRAHYQIAYKRFADKVKETVDQTYVRAIGNDLEGALRRGLWLSSSEKPEEYFSDLIKESEDLEVLRGVLKDKAKKLNAARMKLS